MDGAQFLGRAHVRLALIADDLVGHAEFFEQPQHALRAGIVEMMHRQHGRPPIDAALVPAGRAKVETPVRVTPWVFLLGSLTSRIYPGNILPNLRNRMTVDPAYVAFDGDRRIGSGSRRDVARAAREALDRNREASILVFDNGSSALVDIDLRGSVDDVLARIPPVTTQPADEDA